MRRIKDDKKGIIGSFITRVVSIIAITALLLIFIIISGIFKTFVNTELRVYEESDTGIADTIRYTEGNYQKITTIRYLQETQKPNTLEEYDNIIKETGYPETET